MGTLPEGSRHEDEGVALTSTIDRSARRTIGAILIGSILLKLAFIWYLGDRLYFDNLKAVNFGLLVHRGDFAIDTQFVNSKTFLGPLIWFRAYDWFGVLGLKLANLTAFVLLFVAAYRLAAPYFPRRTVLLGLFLLAFYAGTNRNVVAGEPDDNVAALLFSVAVLAFLNRGSRLWAGVLMGVGFLFKFWIAVFGLAVGVFLLWKRRWRDAALVTAGAALPFLIVSAIDRGQSLRSLLVSERIQNELSSWTDLLSRTVSTGLLFAFLASAWSWRRDRTDVKTLYFLIFVFYVAYVFINRDAFTMTFVMMQCLVFCAFLIADAVLAATDGWMPFGGRTGLLAFCALYVVAMTAITWQHLYRDTVVMRLVQTPRDVEFMFRFLY